MNYTLGVDVGTTFTAVGISRSGRTEIASLGNHGWAAPSVVYLGADQQVLVGEPALRRAVTDPSRSAREFKRRIGDPVPIIVGGAPVSADLLTSKVLTSVIQQVLDLESGPPDHIVITHPANWGPYKIGFLQQAVRLAAVDELCPVSFLTEPEAAAAYYASTERLAPGEVIAVYDLGGGTFDTAILRRTATGWEFLAPAEGIERLGGIDFDEAVFDFVNTAVDGRVMALDPSDASAMAAVQQLRRDCAAAKEALSSDVDATIRVVLPAFQRDVRLTRAEFEAMVAPSVQVSVESLQRALRSAGVSPANLRAVLLVGGSSRIPLVSEVISRTLNVPVAVDAHPKHAVALGAALTADVRAHGPVAAPPPVTPIAPAGNAPGTGRRTRRLPLVIGAAVLTAAIAVALYLILRPVSTPSDNLGAGGPTTGVGTESATSEPATSAASTEPATRTEETTSADETTSAATPSESSTPPRPVTVAVLSSTAWTDTGVDCAPGSILDITASGTVLHNKDDPNSAVGPDGLVEPFFHQFNVAGLPDANTVALIGSLDRNQPYFVVGSATTYACPSAGTLFLGVNDVGVANNSGSFEAVIETKTP